MVICAKVMVAQTKEVRTHILNIFEDRAIKDFLMNWKRAVGEKQSQMTPGFLFLSTKGVYLPSTGLVDSR